MGMRRSYSPVEGVILLWKEFYENNGFYKK
jgi:hypothetical protein